MRSESLIQVNSGLVVNTTAHYHEATDTFTLNSPDRGAWKNWISQVPKRETLHTNFCAPNALHLAPLTLHPKPSTPSSLNPGP
jgi:hypothetical protein